MWYNGRAGGRPLCQATRFRGRVPPLSPPTARQSVTPGGRCPASVPLPVFLCGCFLLLPYAVRRMPRVADALEEKEREEFVRLKVIKRTTAKKKAAI